MGILNRTRNPRRGRGTSGSPGGDGEKDRHGDQYRSPGGAGRRPEPGDDTGRSRARAPGGGVEGVRRIPFDPGASTAPSAWREGALTRILELEALYDWVEYRSDSAAPSAETATAPDPPPGCVAVTARDHLASARHAAQHQHGWWRSVSGATHERVSSNCDAAEADLLRKAPDDYLYGQLPNFLAHAERHLDRDDMRLRSFRALVERLNERLEQPSGAAHQRLRPDRSDPPPITGAERTQIVAAVRAASSQAGREQMRVRSFRNVLIVTTVVMTVLAVGVALFGLRNPTAIPLCFTPVQQNGGRLMVCPTEQNAFTAAEDLDAVLARTVDRLDLLTIEFAGLIAAAISAALALKNLRGSSVPFGLPIALALLKLPMGALTALVGLVLMRGEFVPGLSALDSSAQILAWAVLFGYAQQLFTRFVDQRAQNVLDSVRGAKSTAAEESPGGQAGDRTPAPNGRAPARPA
ncbi:hypothetical protein [Planobispora longispora]|uniref:Uncharacterized protein n=1 Tax=Planobispora longispora TaxID=28887 RepID=A0A8J3W612_9ACTN|nr:hypothetical protein [Planobispora longispora]GIH77043.1 hypothetical protein Plo01_34720 [Planobispora longispora]